MGKTKPKDLGTAYETANVAYARERTGDSRIERRAQHGSRDMGDVYGIRAHGHEGIMECKRVERLTDALLDRFKAQALAERGNADADFVLLSVWRKGKGYRWASSPTGTRAKSFGENDVQMTYETLMKVSGARGDISVPEHALDTWVSISMADFALMCMEVDA